MILTAVILMMLIFASLIPIWWSNPFCPDGIKFKKIWKGATHTIEGNITIVDANTGEVYFNDTLSPSKVIELDLLHDTELIISWTDWRGEQVERHIVKCVGQYDTLTNDIPYPKSGSVW
jgi:hypothetical protein